MPLGFERLNERSRRPNALINFIKPLDGPDRTTAEDLLNRIAAQCYPVMKAAHISVMSLEEFPPNREFLGRNFNAGESIQLVLKDRQGRWLGFKFVQMIMMHELAHCKQMNHSKFFWQVRNQFASEMHELWAKKYLGEGLWGRGQDLTTGGFVMDREIETGDVPEHLCGGTYRRRGRKRKRNAAGQHGDEKQSLTYAERQQRRIAKKFGKHGDGSELGGDDLVRGAYEQGKQNYGRPRVANSKRGRELRAQAALARFGAAKASSSKSLELEIKAEPDDDSDIDWSDSDLDSEAGSAKGVQDYVKICGDEDVQEGATDEMKELRAMGNEAGNEQDTIKASTIEDLTDDDLPQHRHPPVSHDVSETESEHEEEHVDHNHVPWNATTSDDPDARLRNISHDVSAVTPREKKTPPKEMVSSASPCPICSLDNTADAYLCAACSHVLRPTLVRDAWRCDSASCRESSYMNAGDAGRCGVCGAMKPAVSSTLHGSARLVGVMGADVLRWD